MKNHLPKGIYLALLTAFISGIAIFVNKFAVEAVKPPLVFTTFKNTGVGLLIIGFLLVSGRWQQIKTLTKREKIYLVLIGIIGGSLPFYLFFTGLSQVTAINAALLQKTLVFWVILLAVPFLKEKLSPLQGLAILILFASNFVIGGFQGFKFSQAEGMILLAALLWGVEHVLAKKILPSVSPDLVTAARMGFGSLILLIASALTAPEALRNSLQLTSNQMFWMSITIITLLAYVVTWYRALKFAPAITVTTILVSSTLITNILSAVFITHTWTLSLHIQNGMLLAGVILFWFATNKMRLPEKQAAVLQEN